MAPAEGVAALPNKQSKRRLTAAAVGAMARCDGLLQRRRMSGGKLFVPAVAVEVVTTFTRCHQRSAMGELKRVSVQTQRSCGQQVKGC